MFIVEGHEQKERQQGEHVTPQYNVERQIQEEVDPANAPVLDGPGHSLVLLLLDVADGHYQGDVVLHEVAILAAMYIRMPTILSI